MLLSSKAVMSGSVDPDSDIPRPTLPVRLSIRPYTTQHSGRKLGKTSNQFASLRRINKAKFTLAE